MTAIQRGTWRVVGRSSNGDTLLLKPLFDADFPAGLAVGGCLPVSTREYGGDVQAVVDEVRQGNRLEAGVYPGRTGRFVDVRIVDSMRLWLGSDVERVPSVAVDLWTRGVGNAREGDPVAASMPFDVNGTHAELHVVQSTNARADDVWWAFVAGDGGESLYGSFEYADGTPAEVVAANPRGRPFFYVMTFAAADTRPAVQLREEFERAATEATLASLRAQLAEAGIDADVRVAT